MLISTIIIIIYHLSIVFYRLYFNWFVFRFFYSPCYIDNSADLAIAAKRILWGKIMNAGQTCIAPDYLLCTKEVESKFIEEGKKVLKEWFGDNPRDSPDLCRIINQRNFQ